MNHVDAVLGKIKEAGLTASKVKCLWAQTACTFLGHFVGGGRVSPSEHKVQAVRDFVPPTTKSGVRRFLGLTGYYRRFISDYAAHSVSLTEVTCKVAPDKVEWSQVRSEEFLYLQHALCSIPSLTLPTQANSFLLQTDASAVGLGAVFSVRREEKETSQLHFTPGSYCQGRHVTVPQS